MNKKHTSKKYANKKHTNKTQPHKKKHGRRQQYHGGEDLSQVIAKTRELIAQSKLSEPPDPSTFTLDDWQKQAIAGLTAGDHVVVDAPTSAGKTKVVEDYFHKNLQNPSFRAVYTTPVKSLSNDKMREFQAEFGEQWVGLSTGDLKENLSAPIIVATLESYRNSLLGTEPDLNRSLVIFDEYHFLQDQSRGSSWEEAIILTPKNCQLLLLSASVKNPLDFANWIEGITNRRCQLVSTKTRPVPIKPLVYRDGKWLLPPQAPSSRRGRGGLPPPPRELAVRLAKCEDMGLTPCIVYSGRRQTCEVMAKALCDQLEPLSKERSGEILAELELADERYQSMAFLNRHVKKMIIQYGVGYHHSGIGPGGRIAIEQLLKKGLLRFCVATMGLSIGINFSVKSTVIADYKRPGETGFVYYSNSEILQMSGRAGRRGKDLVGFSLWFDHQIFGRFGHAHRDDCRSMLKQDPFTLLGLVGRGYDLGMIEAFYRKSFLKFLAPKINFQLIRPKMVAKTLSASLPCQSPAYEFSLVQSDLESLCDSCEVRRRCHPLLGRTLQDNDLAGIHFHLHQVDCLDEHDQLTELGKIARYFPHPGGFVIARWLYDGKIHENNIDKAVELIACLQTAGFKKPRIANDYRFPFDESELLDLLFDYYPESYFPGVYDEDRDSGESIIREFNPAAGFIVKEWLQEITWPELVNRVTTEKFKGGDALAVIYRVCSVLQAIAQLRLGQISERSVDVRKTLLREPVLLF